MSDLTNAEKRKLEALLDMNGGYVLDFSNRKYDEFVFDSTKKLIYDGLYNYGSNSKAARTRGFWTEESNATVAKLIGDLIDYGEETNQFDDRKDLIEPCRQIVLRLSHGGAFTESGVLHAITSDADFETLAKELRAIVEGNKPEIGLDRLHTFVIKYVRTLCAAHAINIPKDRPLHSAFGEYAKFLKDNGHLQSDMAFSILRSNIKVLEDFNKVRNTQSLAHDNPLLAYPEALLIFNHVTSTIRFIRSVEDRIGGKV